MEDIPCIDIHVHPSADLIHAEDVIRIFSLTGPAENTGDFLFSAGIHPKDAGYFRIQDFSAMWDDPHCIAIGECGLDRRYAPEIHLSKQTEIFLSQAEEAESRHIP